MKHQEPRGLGLYTELRINHSFQRNTAGSSCAAWGLNPVDTAHHSSQRTWRREQYSMRGTVRPQVQVQFLPEKAEEYYFDLCTMHRLEAVESKECGLEVSTRARRSGCIGKWIETEVPQGS
ncbi:hypothetical protein B0H13DRAFT_1858748 [Mycena leptocephala]|nr:hypothetical protein B0H13DRAFT_1858748 [Mycena leptocephala]